MAKLAAVGMALALVGGVTAGPASTASGRGVPRIELEPDKVSILGQGAQEPPVPEAWARLRVADFVGARARFASAIATAGKFDPALVWGYEIAAVLARDPPDRIVASLDPDRLAPADRARALRTLVAVYLDYGEVDRARRARDLLVPVVANDGLALAALYLDDAEDDLAALHWDPMLADLRQAQAAVADSRTEARQGIGTRIFNRAVELSSVYAVTGDRKIAAAARAAFSIYLELPGAAQAIEAMHGQADLDFHLAPGATSLAMRGSLDKTLLLRFLRTHVHELEGCYRRALLRDPTLGGGLQLVFAIAAGGAVRNIKAQPSGGSLGGVPACVAAAAKTWRFPAGGETIDVVYPLTFEIAQ